jgi:DNA primase
MTGTDLETLRAINRIASAFYTDIPRRSRAESYLRQRGIDAASLPRSWTIGYAPPHWTQLVGQLRHQFTEQALLDAGVARVSGRGTLIDTFRDRVLFPIHDTDGTIAGFVGRDLSGRPDAPKYLNTRQSPLFDKSRLLYGLYEGSAEGDEVQPVIVEGPLDVLAIAARQAESGRRDLLPVAACGTSFTAKHARAVGYAVCHEGTQVMVAMDGDPAGRAAALKVGELLREQELDVLVAVLPSGFDPADYLATSAGSVEAFSAERGLSLVEAHVADAIAKQGDRMQWIEGRLAALRCVARYLATYPTDVAARQVGELAEALNLSPWTVTSELVDAHGTRARVASRQVETPGGAAVSLGV